jgi:hypothetical protein
VRPQQELEDIPYLDQPPAIDPAQWALEEHDWPGQFTLWLVHYDDRYYVWVRLVRPEADSPLVTELPDEQAAREYLAVCHSKLVLDIDNDVIAAVCAGLPALNGDFLYWANVADSGANGFWLAVLERDDRLVPQYSVERFDSPGSAVEAFAAATETAAGTAATLRLPWADIAAAQLKFRARLARAGAARAELGDLLRASAGLAREQRALSDLGQTAGISRAFLYRIIDGSQWTWPGTMVGSADAFLSGRLPADAASRGVAPASPAGGQDSPPPHSAAESAQASWQAWIRLAIGADSRDDALAIAAVALRQRKLVTRSEPIVAQLPEGSWAVHTDLDLTAIAPTFEPDTAHTRAIVLSGLIGEGPVSWGIRESPDHCKLEWPPDIWSRRPGRDDSLLHPAVRALIVWVSAEPA